jgi:ligand-binding sensor protein
MQTEIDNYETGILDEDWHNINTICKTLMGASCQIISSTGSFLIGEKNQSSFCLFIQNTKEGRKRCRTCHSFNFRKNPSDKEYQNVSVFKCYAGLTQFLVPLSAMSAVISPGVIDNNKKQCQDDLAKILNLSIDSVWKKCSNIKYLPNDQIISTANLVQTILGCTFERLINERKPIITPNNSNTLQLKEDPDVKSVMQHKKDKHVSITKIRQRRIVITGLGIISCTGIGKTEFVQSLRKGKSGIKRIEKFDPSKFKSQIAGEVRKFDPLKYMNKKKMPRGRATQFAVAASKMAFEDALLDINNLDVDRIGVIIGSLSSGMEYVEAEHTRFLSDKKVSPYASVAAFGGAISGEISIHQRIKGPSFTISTGCASSVDAIGYAVQWIRSNKADIMIAEVKRTLHPLY